MATKQARVAADRRSRSEQMRKEQQRKERRTRLLITAGGAVLVVIIVAVIAVAIASRPSKAQAGEMVPAAVDPTPVTTQKPLKPIKDTSGIPGVLAWDTTAQASTTGQPAAATADQGIEHTHVTGPVAYAVTPPVGGPHNGTWMTAGAYDKPVPNERAVHDLEHGVVWITYDPNLPAGEVSTLRALVKKQKDATLKGQDLQARYMDLSPWATNTLPSPIVISAWGRQLRVTSAGDPRLQRFIDAFRMDPSLTYEAGADVGPAGGDTTTSGNPLFS